MRRTWVLALAAGATLVVAAPSAADAQSRSIRERWEEARRDGREESDRERAREQEAERQRERVRAAERERERIRELERERAEERVRAEERAREQRAESVREAWERQRRINAAEERRREEERERLRNRRERDRDRNDDWYDDDDYRRNVNGPAFCRSGEGHPVHGREWCRQRGYELGRDRGWDRADRDRWGNIVFRDGHRRRREERLNRSRLTALLGNTWVNRFESYGRRHGYGSLTGYWAPATRGNVLELQVGGVPYARLVDFNRDNRVDDLLLRR